MGRTAWYSVVLAGCLVGCLVGCLQPQLVECGDQLCPVGNVCVGGSRCASADQLAACIGLDNGGDCTLGAGDGTCSDGICVISDCGDGVTGVDEVCDDGNRTSGDGCRADCAKIEMCGDSVVDLEEDCDDGNANPADGCDLCRATTWAATAIIGGNTSATSVALAFPDQVLFDPDGNLYLYDSGNAKIRRVDKSGVMTTVAGTGTSGFTGDGGPATSAQIEPSGIAIDGLGNLYLSSGTRIRRVNHDGIITTIATGSWLAQSIAVDGLGNLYFAQAGGDYIYRRDPLGAITTFAGNGTAGSSNDGQPATSAAITAIAIAVDNAGTLYLAGDNRLRKIVDGTISTVTTGLGVVTGIVVAADGSIYVAEENANKIRRVAANGTITTIAGTGLFAYGGDGGPALAADLWRPLSVAVDASGNVYIADSENHRIRRVGTDGIITTIAGTGSYGGTFDGTVLEGAAGVEATSDGTVYVADPFNNRILRFTAAGVMTTFAGNGRDGFDGDGGKAVDAQLQYPLGVTVDGAGNVYIGDTLNCRVRKVDGAGIITTIAGDGQYGGGVDGEGGPALSAQVCPSDLAFDAAGLLYIADRINHRIRRINANGTIQTVAGTGAVGSSGDNGPATAAQLQFPTSIAFDLQGALLIADPADQRIRKVSGGIITTIAGTGTLGDSGDGAAATAAQLRDPQGLAVDSLGRIYIGSYSGARVRRIATDGTISTIAGTGTDGYSGDGGPALQAELGTTPGIAIDGAANLYLSDELNSTVRRIDSTGIITTLAPLVDPAGTGPLTQATLAAPVALVTTTIGTIVAGGATGTVELLRNASQQLEVVAGRYPQQQASGVLARFRTSSFGAVGGVAYDAAGGRIFISEPDDNRIEVITIVDPANEHTWTLQTLANVAGAIGFANGAAATALFRAPTGLYFDAVANDLYVADTGNHVIRAISLATGVASATVRTVAGTPATRGFAGDDSTAAVALLYAPTAVTRCANGDLFIADTGNHRVRRVTGSLATITTVLGVGVAASSGVGRPASTFPVNAPRGLACDELGNVYATSTTTVRLLPANAAGVVDGTGDVLTIYGAPPIETFPATVTKCLGGIVVIDAATVHVADACTGLLVELSRR